jgi:tetratricopeptide (TPR) repeat protein
VATLVLLVRRPQLGVLPAMFFLVLAPSSSILPIRDLAVEHRMYLPLATIVVGVVVSSFALTGRVLPSWAPKKWAIAVPLAILLLASGVLGGVTIARNRVYLAETTLWRDVIAKAPHNARGHYNLALKLQHQGETEKALEQFRLAAVAAQHDRATVRALISAKYGVTLVEAGEIAVGLPLCEQAALLDPHVSEVQVQLGNARALAGDDRGALRAYQRAIEIRPSRVDAHFNLGQIAQRAGELALAERHLAIAAKLNPKLPQIHQRLARLRLQLRSENQRRASAF